MYRYVALVWDTSGPDRRREFLECAKSKCPRWSTAYDGPGILAVHLQREQGSATSHELHGRSGVVLGQLFQNSCEDYSSARDVAFDETRTVAIVNSGGQYLIDHYWGSYLAIVYDRAANRHHVLRDPIGTLPCYHLQQGGVNIFFSHLDDCIRLAPFPLRIDRRHLVHWLLFSSIRTDRTGLENVTHLRRGVRLTLAHAKATYTRVWDPIALASGPVFQSPAEAASALRGTVQNAVNAWASRYPRIAHKVSGGLDSAIVAGCLAQAPSSPEVTYLNMAIAPGQDREIDHLPGIDAGTAAKIRAVISHGDERSYARLVSQRWNVPIIERQRCESLDLARLEQAPLTAAPPMYFAVVEMDDLELELIHRHGTRAFFSGQGGDSVFQAALQPLPAMDHAYLHCLSRGLWQQVVASAALSRDSIWSVIGKTVKHGLLRLPYTRRLELLNRPTLLRHELVRSLREEDLLNPFAQLATHSALPPGKKDLIKGIASAFHSFVFHAGEHADHIDPLNSQPVWEAMLRIPTYTILMGGVSRGLARYAFAGLLPPQISRRLTKGTGTSFYQQLVRRNRSYLLERLETGLLIQEGYLDRRRLVKCLTADEPSITIPAPILMAYLAAEIWLQKISNVAATGYDRFGRTHRRQANVCDSQLAQ